MPVCNNRATITSLIGSVVELLEHFRIFTQAGLVERAGLFNQSTKMGRITRGGNNKEAGVIYKCFEAGI